MFALFAGHDYYPAGGWDDFRGVYESVEAAEAAFRAGDPDESRWEWGHVVDLSSREEVARW